MVDEQVTEKHRQISKICDLMLVILSNIRSLSFIADRSLVLIFTMQER